MLPGAIEQPPANRFLRSRRQRPQFTGIRIQVIQLLRIAELKSSTIL